MKVTIYDDAFDGIELANEYRREYLAKGKYGASSIFVGTMRDFNDGNDVLAMTLEHYPAMTQHTLETIAAKLEAEHDLLDIYIAHRVGELHPNDDIVVVAAFSAHRKNAFEASREMMEELKKHAPFWKKEQRPSGEKWVEKNTPGF